jgi:hypothetical protein
MLSQHKQYTRPYTKVSYSLILKHSQSPGLGLVRHLLPYCTDQFGGRVSVCETTAMHLELYLVR